MLTRLWSPAFHRNGKPRPVITMHAGLKIVEGSDQAQHNSIGKSTLLQIIDFVYAGKNFLDSDAVRFPQAVGHHTIHFTLRLNGQDRHFVRATDRPGFVTRYHDPNWHEADRDCELAEYQQFLLDEYGLEDTGGTWRELVGRFSRVDERDMGLLDRPLAAAARANDIDGAKALLRLFGAHEEIDKIQSRYDQVRKEVDALNAMAKGKYSSYIKFTTKKERDAAQKELLEARSEAKQLRTHADLDLFQAEQKARQEQALKRAQMRPLVQELDAINSRLAIVEATLSGKTRITTRDLEEFYEFFPHANRESLEIIEYYHHQLTGILEDQLHEQQRHYQAQAAELKVAIHNLQAQILALGQSVQFDDEIYDQSAEVQAKINRLEEQIHTFDHNGDTGSGAIAKNLIVFDLAVLNSTPLPFLIHDSAIIKTVAFAPVRELLTIYANSDTLESGAHEPKQVFFSFDATKAYGTGVEEIVTHNQIIHLDEGTEALYGFTWNLETDATTTGRDNTP
ncbi:DUF2326 domain-containing protein [Gleimia hominis]|uniref:DUF2326 domain-containing protein n=1 Tax=Gleimia hominis TaxID=595468 RepID=A0ABU3IBM3_9ACTO|nr:DUF2326 domain-containing protein [Gleimia hominis]MDT3767775.1 DUF2326 domain-containing protein [Gleimia hominis]